MANAWILAPLSPAATTHVSGTLTKGDASYPFNDFAGIVWESACDASGNKASLQFDLGADTSIDTIMLFGVELLPTAGSALTVDYATAAQGAFTGSFASDSTNGTPYAGSAMPVSGKGFGLFSLAAPVTARYVRLTFAAGAAGKSVRIARIAAGKRIQLERNFGFGGTFGVRDLGSLDFSARAVLLRRLGKKLRTLALTFSNIRKDEVEAQTKPLIEQIGNTSMVAILTDPVANAQRQNRAYFGPLVGDLAHTQRNSAGWEAKINQVSIF